MTQQYEANLFEILLTSKRKSKKIFVLFAGSLSDDLLDNFDLVLLF
jgi:hypothetical protein